MTRPEIEAFFKDRQLAWARRDPEGLAAGHADDGVIDSPMFGHRQGRQAIRETYRALFEIFPDWDYQVEDLLIDRHRVAHPFIVTATHVGTFMGHAGSDRRFRIQGARFYRMNNGLIQTERRIYDFTGLLMQIGVLKGKPA
jgi:steroid delta-isomerase-like uncharacterized protein